MAPTPTIVHQLQQPQPQPQQQPIQQHQLHQLQMLSTGQGLATIVPALQHINPSHLRVIPGDARQLLVQSNAGSESRPVTLVTLHSSAMHHSGAAANETRPMAFVHSGNEATRTTALLLNTSATTANNASSALREISGTALKSR